MVKSFGQAFGPRAIFNVAKELDKLDAGFVRATGFQKTYTSEIINSQRELAKFGVSLADSTKGYQEASTGIIGFNNKGSEFQKNIVNQSLLLEKLGVSQESFFKNVNNMNVVLGMTQEKAAETQKSLVSLSNGLGMSVSQVNQNLLSNMNRLSIYGRETINQFSRLQTYSKLTNIEIGTLTDLTEKLSTFEGAGEFAGRLNALAGMDLFDVAELATLEGADKIEYIISRVQQAGFDLDDPKMMRAIAQASGISPDQFKSLSNLTGDKLRDALKEIDSKKDVKVEDVAAKAVPREEVLEAIRVSKVTSETALEAYRGSTNLIIESLDAIPGAVLNLTATIAELGLFIKDLAGGSKDSGGGSGVSTFIGSLLGSTLGGGGKLLKGAGSTALKTIGKVGIKGPAALAGGLVLDYGADKLKESGYEKTGAGVDIASSALSGAGMGAMVGSIIPGLGTAIGAGVGGALGTAYGLYQNSDALFGKKAESNIVSSPIPAATPQINTVTKQDEQQQAKQKTQQEADKPILLHVYLDSREIARATNKELMPRMSG